jgi:hypothetical protein
MKQIDAEIAKVRRQENGNTRQSSR